MSIKTDLRHVIYALSDALDLVGVDDVAHGKRVGIMAAECARVSGWPEDEVLFMFDLGLLHDIGVSSTRTHSKLVGMFDWAGSQVHCEVGCGLLKGFAPFARMAEPVRLHHTRWDQLVAAMPAEGGPERSVALQANLIYLVDRVDALAAPHYVDGSLLLSTRSIREEIARHVSTYFAPELVELFLQASLPEAFWLNLEPRSIQACLADRLLNAPAAPASMGDLRQLAEIFSRIVDAKSPFTAEHSLGVARVARFLAQRMGVSEMNCEKIEIAGLLHDLGKLRVPDEILEKPGRLEPGERMTMNAHSFETFQILRNIEGFDEIAPWAAYHHEEPGGTGYPYRLKGESLPLEARILRVADIFQAMIQNRPYRSGLSAGDVRTFMQDFAARGKVDGDVVAVLLPVVSEAMEIARPGLPTLVA